MTILTIDENWDSDRKGWIAAFYDEDRLLIGAAYELPFTVPEGSNATLLSRDFVLKIEPGSTITGMG